MPYAKPTFYTTPVALNGEKRDIPLETEERGRLSLTRGFPTETETPPEAGGIAPNRRDFNGVNNLISSHQVFLQYGGVYGFEAAVAADGGYPKGIVLGFDNPAIPMRVRSLVDGNTDNFNTNPGSIGVSWAIESPGPLPWNPYLDFSPPCMVFGQDGKL